ncbi:hypothetical protein RDI58_028978 [Solanum bulbocastanum]|uniref:Uncharacterized protein n=1 Tax=Solanum bulbocastanum TaxID=147425 RepID=A0AAN8XZ67_SOLBU
MLSAIGSLCSKSLLVSKEDQHAKSQVLQRGQKQRRKPSGRPKGVSNYVEVPSAALPQEEDYSDWFRSPFRFLQKISEQ